MKYFCSILILILGFSSCVKDREIIVEGLVPIYFDALDFSEIKTLPAQEIVKQGKIVKQGDFLFINELKKGVHVIDNTNPTDPKYILFWNIPGNQNFTLNGDYLYADNGPHMVVINISDFENIVFDRYIEDVFFENILEQYPENRGYFQCAIPENGLVKEWVMKTLTNPNCKKI